MIGIFDSGVGGLSIFSELRKLNPDMGVIYFADSANFPYGEKSQAELVKITSAATEKLAELSATTIVVACNSATVSTIDHLRKKFPKLAFVGVEPAVKVAAASSRGIIGLLATKKTVHTHDGSALAMGAVIHKHHDARLIEKIENDYGDISEADLEQALRPLLLVGADTIVLGCSHYYFVRERFKRDFPAVSFVEPSAAVANRVLQISGERSQGKSSFLVSGDVSKFSTFLVNVVGYKNADIRKV